MSQRNIYSWRYPQSLNNKNDPWVLLDKRLLSEEELNNLNNSFTKATEHCKKAGYTNDEHREQIKQNYDKVASIKNTNL